MLYFLSDYTEGCHPKVMERLAETNRISQPGYGEDCFCRSAREKIRAACGLEKAEVFFLSGGTQTNLVTISALLHRHEAVIAAESGHIAVHEAGAIEFTGHKVIPLPARDGKLDAGELDAYLTRFYADATHEHMPAPGMVYLSQPTELGTLYSKAELQALSAVCRRRGLPLFADGARLGYGLMSPGCDLSLPEFARLCDVFSIGGTKVGALCGEALVFSGIPAPRGFFTMIKQQGALLAKGRLLGVQFDALFTDGLYWEISRQAVRLALELKEAFREKGCPLYADSPTNQQFVVLTPQQLERLGREAAFSVWEPLADGRTAVRFVTSWATRPEDVEALKALL